MLPMEVVVPSLRVSKHNGLNPQEYNEAMMMKLDALDGKILQVLDHIMIQKKKVAGAYNKWIKINIFEEGELVWKVVLLIDAKDRELGNWSPNWEGPFKVNEILPENAYWLSSLKEELHKRFINGKYLEKYFPQCGKCWILPRKTKIGNEGITSKNRSH